MSVTNQRLLAVFLALVALLVAFVVATADDQSAPSSPASANVPTPSALDNPDVWERCTMRAKRMTPIVCGGSYKVCAQEHQHGGAWEALRCLREEVKR
jgi:hypothetical protein